MAMQIHDPMKELRESLRAMQMHDPMKELRESLRAMQMHDPMKELRESLKAMQIHDPMKELRESLKAMQMHDPMKDLRESLKAMQMRDPMKDLRESLKAMQMHDPMKDLRESLKAMQMHDPMKDFRESLKAMQMHDPMKELREAIKAAGSLGDLVKGMSNDRWALMLDGGSDIQINVDGMISVNSKVVTQEQVQEIAQRVISNALNEEVFGFEQYIDRLIHEIRSLKDPAIQKILAWLIYPLIVGLILSFANPVVDYYIKERLSNNEKRLVVREVSKTIVSTFNEKSYLKSFRIVSATSINVRRSNSNTSDIIGTLFLGDVVEIIEKGRKWSLISWQDNESGALVQGWVFSRYLKAIR